MNSIFKATMALMLVAILFASSASAYVFRNETQEREEEWQRWLEYKSDYIQLNELDGYEQFIYEPNLARNFGFYPNSRYIPPRDAWIAKYAPPLQGEVYSTETRYHANSLGQPSAVKYYAENTNGRLSGYIQPDLNGVYFDHPQAQVTYGYISTYPGAVGYGYGYGYGNTGNARFYARVADQITDDYYVVGFY